MMLSDNKLQLVRTLTRSVVETFVPHKLASFEEEFAPFALTGGLPQVQERAGFLKSRDQGLDTTLVAGMFFEVLLEAEQLPASTSERVSYVRKQAKNYLVNRLAGQISLSQFFRLLNLIDENVQRYFAHLRDSWTNPPRNSLSQSMSQLSPSAIRIEALRQGLAHLPMESTGRRKLTQEKLLEFLLNTQGGWFKLLDFETCFQVNKKTAWAYLNQLLEDGILVHNGEKANKVRYTLASRFLKTESLP
jgi:Fic family protein